MPQCERKRKTRPATSTRDKEKVQSTREWGGEADRARRRGRTSHLYITSRLAVEKCSTLCRPAEQC